MTVFEELTKDKPEEFKRIAYEILRHFDFEKVHKVMVALKWEWLLGHDGGKSIMGIPSVRHLQGTALELISTCYENKSGTVSTGGFMAFYDKKEDVIELSFNIESHAFKAKI